MITRLLTRVLLLGAAVGSGSCLVVSDPDFRGQEDCIPFFVTEQAVPAPNATTRIPASPGEPLEFDGNVPMRSCALTKTYQMRVFLDNVWQYAQDVPPTGDEARPIAVILDMTGRAAGCHQVEVLVSTRFASGTDPKTTDRADDLAYMVWWFSNDTTGNVKFKDCGSP
ncbi:MAG: hypothetical protein ACXVEF_22555 [Polyangiales bacterium]